MPPRSASAGLYGGRSLVGSEKGRWYSPGVIDGTDWTNRTPDLASWRRALDTSFRVHFDGGGTFDLTLVSVDALERRPGWESFSLLFAGPTPTALWQGTFLVEHTDVGRFPLFIVAVQTDGDGQHYEAVVNRPAP